MRYERGVSQTAPLTAHVHIPDLCQRTPNNKSHLGPNYNPNCKILW